MYIRLLCCTLQIGTMFYVNSTSVKLEKYFLKKVTELNFQNGYHWVKENMGVAKGLETSITPTPPSLHHDPKVQTLILNGTGLLLLVLEGFLTSACLLLTQLILCWGLGVDAQGHCRMLKSIPGLYLLNASSTTSSPLPMPHCDR